VYIEGHRLEVKGRGEAAQQEVERGDPMQSRFQDCTIEEGSRGGRNRWGRNCLHKLQDLEGSSIVLARDGCEERGVAFSITAAQLERK
jgi:hypothetical protein